MGTLNLLPLGEPPASDVDAAAKLYLRYDESGMLTDEVAQSFAMMVDDFGAVYDRAVEIKRGKRQPDKNRSRG